MAQLTLRELKDRAAQAGVVGAGGAGFPAAVKLAAGADSYIINGAECEPLIFSDYHILQQHLDQVLFGARRIMDAAGIEKGYLAIRRETARLLGIEGLTTLDYGIRLFLLPDVYPMGDELVLIYEVLGRLVPPGQLPLSQGVLVNNVETVLNLGAAIDGCPVTEKWITVGGNVARPVGLKVKIGTPVKALFEHLGIVVPRDHGVLDGGPAMGSLIDWETAAVTKTTKAILVLPGDLPAVTAKQGDVRRQMDRASAACCQCTLCSELCPRALLGYGLRPHRTVRSVAARLMERPEEALPAAMCCGCGICDLVACCQGILPRTVMMETRGRILAQNLRYQPKESVQADPDRHFRLVPHRRFAAMAGVAGYDRATCFEKLEWSARKLVLPLKQHAGSPAESLVGPGQKVEAGQPVAQAKGAVSAWIHSPVRGWVERITDKHIEIVTGESAG